MAFRDFVGITLVGRDAFRPSPHNSSLEQFKTVAFEASIMDEHITLDWFEVAEPRRWPRQTFGFVIGTWLCIVPECYRARVIEIATGTFNREFRGKHPHCHREDTIDQFIHALRRDIWAELDPVEP